MVWRLVIWRVGGLGKIGRLSAIESETVREEIQTDEKSQDFSGELWAVCCGECEMRAVCCQGFEGVSVGCKDKITH